ncbi:MAG: transposase [Gallionella sp.]|jgi:REP element-mobilizing transposase RayT|nr:transposase [Gallionella sp.]MCK9354363.1 transposase [Gallionella sp.]
MLCHDSRHRHSIRLQGYDYSQAGAYFITVCAQDRKCLFGDIADGEMALNGYGCAVQNEWIKTAEIRSGIQLGEFVVMPNHFHGILIIDDDLRRGTACRALVDDEVRREGMARPEGTKGICAGSRTARRAPTERFGQSMPGSLPTIVRAFKSAVTKHINGIRQSPGVSIWQRNYYEHVIRNEADYRQIAEYIIDNPRRWEEDVLHPDRTSGR